ncbi:MAG: glycosyltransferase family 4 protein [Candidatus Helarchaeota archaeon]
MKILYITLQFYPNSYGSGIHAYEVCLHLSKLGHKVYVLTISNLGFLSHEVWKNIHIYRIRFPFNNPYYNQFNPILFWLFGKSIVNRIKPDVIIGHGFESSLFIRYSKVPIKIYKAVGTICVQKKVRPVITWLDKIGIIGFIINSKLEKLACKYSTKIIAISNSIKNELIKYYEINPKKICIIYNGVNLSRFDVKSVKKSNKIKNIIYVGRLSSIKGPQILLKLIPKIINDYGDTIQFIFIGNGPLNNYLRQLVKKSKYNKYIKFKGYIPYNKMPYIYSKADICIIPSYYEPFGLVALECLASHLPVLASRIGGLLEIFNQFDPNSLFSIQNLNDLVNKIISILLSKKLYPLHKENIKNILKKNFNWEKNVELTLKLLKLMKKK